MVYILLLIENVLFWFLAFPCNRNIILSQFEKKYYCSSFIQKCLHQFRINFPITSNWIVLLTGFVLISHNVAISTTSHYFYYQSIQNSPISERNGNRVAKAFTTLPARVNCYAPFLLIHF